MVKQIWKLLLFKQTNLSYSWVEHSRMQANAATTWLQPAWHNMLWHSLASPACSMATHPQRMREVARPAI